MDLFAKDCRFYTILSGFAQNKTGSARFLRRFCRVQRLHELVGAGGRLHAAANPRKGFFDFFDCFAADNCGNALQIAVAAAVKLDGFDNIAV